MVPAEAGLFDPPTVVVRASISVDPHTSQLTISSGTFPSILQGIPLQVRTINVMVDRPQFMFNPTDCAPLSIGATITSAQGAVVNVSSPFQAVNCATLGFAPTFSASTQGNGKTNGSGASLTVQIGAAAGTGQRSGTWRSRYPNSSPLG